MRRFVLLFLLFVGASDAFYKKYADAFFSARLAMKKGYRTQYFSTDLKWISDPGKHAAFAENALEVLQNCRRTYPDKNITAVVEEAHEMLLGDWQTFPDNVSISMRMPVKPWRCIDGEFHAETVYVPEGCAFRESKEDEDVDACFQKEDWKEKAERKCGGITNKPLLYSYAMKTPCGIEHFKGVEYVCCPTDIDLDGRERTELGEYRKILQHAAQKFAKILDERNAIIAKYHIMSQTDSKAAEEYYNKELAKLDQRNKEVAKERARRINKIGLKIDDQVVKAMEDSISKEVLGAFNKMRYRHECQDTVTGSMLEALAQKRLVIKGELMERAKIDSDMARHYAESIALPALNFIDEAAKKVYTKCPYVENHKTEEMWTQMITLGFDFPVKWASYYNSNEIFLHLFGKQLGFYKNDDELFDAHGLAFTLRPAKAVKTKKTTTTTTTTLATPSDSESYESEEEDDEENNAQSTVRPQRVKKGDSIPTFIRLSIACILTPVVLFVVYNAYKYLSRYRNFHKIAGEDVLPIMTEDEYNDDSIDDIKMNVYSNPFDRVQNSIL